MQRFHALSAIGALMLAHSAGAAIAVSSANGVTSSVIGGNVTIDASDASQDVTITVTALATDDIGSIDVTTQSSAMYKVTLNVLGAGFPAIGVGARVLADAAQADVEVVACPTEHAC